MHCSFKLCYASFSFVLGLEVCKWLKLYKGFRVVLGLKSCKWLKLYTVFRVFRVLGYNKRLKKCIYKKNIYNRKHPKNLKTLKTLKLGGFIMHYIRLPLENSEALVNLDNVTMCLRNYDAVGEEDGTEIFFSTDRRDSIIVSLSLDEISGLINLVEVQARQSYGP